MIVNVHRGTRLEPFTPDDLRIVRGTLLGIKVIVGIYALMFVVLEITLISGGAFADREWWWLFAPLLTACLAYFVMYHRTVHFPADYRAGHKMVADTEVIRVSKFGFFDDDASEGGYSRMMLGSVYYLYVKDPARKSGQRKFRVKMELYTGLHPGDQVTIGYLPRCGMLLSLDCGAYHYEPVRRRAA